MGHMGERLSVINNCNYSKNIIKMFLFKNIYKYSDKIIVNSCDFKKEVFKYFNLRSKVIYNLSLPISQINKLS